MVLDNKNSSNMPVNELKRHNLRTYIIRLLYKKSPQPASAIAQKLNISLPTARLILNELIDEEIVSYNGTGNSSGGRKPVIYSLSSSAYHVLAIEMGHYEARAVIVDCSNNEKTRVREFETNIDDPGLEEKIDQILNELLRESGLAKDKIAAIGVSMPGLIDSGNGQNRTIKNPEAQNIGQRLTRYLKIGTYIENDARMQALGEFVFGKAKNTKNTIVVNWSWGLGLGMIMNGKIFQGAAGCAGELSHIRIVENGELCECGKRGCLQTIAGARHLLDLSEKEVKNKTISQLTKNFSKQSRPMVPEDIIACAQKGDELAISLLNNVSTNLAWGLSILVQLFNPELIVLNGPLAKAGDYILIPIRQAFNQYCLKNITENIRIEISELGEYSGLRGVSVMAFENIFVDNS